MNKYLPPLFQFPQSPVVLNMPAKSDNVPANQVPAWINWRRLITHMMTEASHGDAVTRALLMIQQYPQFHSRHANVVASLGIPNMFTVAQEMIRDRKDPRSQAPASLTPPTSAKSMTKEEALLTFNKREKCTHILPAEGKMSNPAMNKYAAGRHGHYAKCLLCSRKWHWEKAEKTWKIVDEDALHTRIRAKAEEIPVKGKPEEDGISTGSSRFSSPLPPSSSDGLRGAPLRGWAALNSSRSSGNSTFLDVEMAPPVPPFPDQGPEEEEEVFEQFEWAEPEDQESY